MTRNIHILIFMCMISISISKKMTMTGGWSDVKDFESIMEYAKFASKKISESSDCENHMKLTNITSARKQVVAGMNYKMTLHLYPTECKKEENLSEFTLNECALLGCEVPTICDVTVWVKSWKDFIEVTDSSCQPGDCSC